MDWIRELTAKLNFWDTCQTVLDQPDSLIQDATELAQITEGGQALTREQFLALVDLSPEHEDLINTEGIEFAKDESGQLAWFYDPTADIHFFYA